MPDLLLYVPSISCNHCKATIEKAVAGVGGVRSVKVHVDRRTVDVDFEGEAKTQAVIQAIEKTHKVATHTG